MQEQTSIANAASGTSIEEQGAPRRRIKQRRIGGPNNRSIAGTYNLLGGSNTNSSARFSLLSRARKNRGWSLQQSRKLSQFGAQPRPFSSYITLSTLVWLTTIYLVVAAIVEVRHASRRFSLFPVETRQVSITFSNRHLDWEFWLPLAYEEDDAKSTISLSWDEQEPDYAGLDFATYPAAPFGRSIWEDGEYMDYERQRGYLLQEMDQRGLPPGIVVTADDSISGSPCQPSTWKFDLYPTCNIVHELPVDIGTDRFLGYVASTVVVLFTLTRPYCPRPFINLYSKGAFRQTWLQQDPSQKTYVLKQPLMPEEENDINHTPSSISFYKTNQDARIMERLTASPRIVDMYAHCGLSIASEAMLGGEISSWIVPGTGLSTQSDAEGANFGPRNNLTASEKLTVALEMANALADLHGSPGLIVHGDVHPVQWLQAADGTIKLNDFNNAELLDFDLGYGDYCKKDRGVWGGKVCRIRISVSYFVCSASTAPVSSSIKCILPLSCYSIPFPSTDPQKNSWENPLTTRLISLAWATTYTPS